MLGGHADSGWGGARWAVPGKLAQLGAAWTAREAPFPPGSSLNAKSARWRGHAQMARVQLDGALPGPGARGTRTGDISRAPPAHAQSVSFPGGLFHSPDFTRAAPAGHQGGDTLCLRDWGTCLGGGREGSAEGDRGRAGQLRPRDRAAHSCLAVPSCLPVEDKG